MANVYEMCCINKCCLFVTPQKQTTFCQSHRNKIQQKIKKNTAVKQLDEQQIRLQVSKTFLNHEVQGLQSCILASICHSPGWAAPAVDGFVLTARWWLGSCHGLPLAAAPDVSPAPPAGVAHLSPVLPLVLPTRPHGSPDAAAARLLLLQELEEEKNSVIHMYWGNHWIYQS